MTIYLILYLFVIFVCSEDLKMAHLVNQTIRCLRSASSGVKKCTDWHVLFEGLAKSTVVQVLNGRNFSMGTIFFQHIVPM